MGQHQERERDGGSERSGFVPVTEEASLAAIFARSRAAPVALFLHDLRYIVTSNMTIPKLTLVLRDAAIKPACNEMELHPHFQQPELFRFVLERGIVPIGFRPIGSPTRPARDRTETRRKPIQWISRTR